MGFFSERRLLAYKHTRTHLLLMTFFKCYWIVFLWELSTPPHTQQYLPRLPSQLFAGNTHPFSGDVARGSSCTHKSWAPFWEMKGSKDTYIYTQTGKAKTEGGVQNTARQVYLRRLFDSEEVGLTVCLLQEANEKHILFFPRLLCDNQSCCGI